ncbi:hypothetical protein DVH24_036073 [Malus domestica]|uniref:Uncharacterized protein n=1 Tax=Malus domestica TaxID=3750 RepID=A0A498II62_MALDO|nr:hypothetical protein DVH24_036073 [Malus domestica]
MRMTVLRSLNYTICRSECSCSKKTCNSIVLVLRCQRPQEPATWHVLLMGPSKIVAWTALLGDIIFLAPSSTKRANNNKGDDVTRKRVDNGGGVLGNGERYVVRSKAEEARDKRRSFLPYMQDFVGFFSNEFASILSDKSQFFGSGSLVSDAVKATVGSGSLVLRTCSQTQSRHPRESHRLVRTSFELILDGFLFVLEFHLTVWQLPPPL